MSNKSDWLIIINLRIERFDVNHNLNINWIYGTKLPICVHAQLWCCVGSDSLLVRGCCIPVGESGPLDCGPSLYLKQWCLRLCLIGNPMPCWKHYVTSLRGEQDGLKRWELKKIHKKLLSLPHPCSLAATTDSTQLIRRAWRAPLELFDHTD